MLRKMINVPRLPDESAETHMARWARLLRNSRGKHKFLHGDETSFASSFSWCGHVAPNVMDIASECGGGSRQWFNVLKIGG